MTVSSAPKAEFLRHQFPKAEARDIIIREPARSGFAEQLAHASPHGLDAALDSLTGAYFAPAFDALAPCGRHVVFGAADWTPQGDRVSLYGWLRLAWSAVLRKPAVSPTDLPGKNKAVLGFNLIWLFDRTEEFRGEGGIITRLMELWAELPPPHVGHVVPFE